VRVAAVAFFASLTVAACSAEEWDFGQCTVDGDCSTNHCNVVTHLCDSAPVGGSDAAAESSVEAGDDAADTGLDVATTEAGPDAGVDAGADVGADVGLDVVADVAREVGPDVGADVGPDVGRDAVVDSPADSGPDVLGDGGPCGGCPAGQLCEVSSQRCGQCLPGVTDCGRQMVCDSASLTCMPEEED
jgi:hypothetical protein